MIHPSLLEEKTHDVTSIKTSYFWLWPDKTLPKTKRILEIRLKNKKENDLPTTSQPPAFSASKLFSLIGLSSNSLPFGRHHPGNLEVPQLCWRYLEILNVCCCVVDWLRLPKFVGDTHGKLRMEDGQLFLVENVVMLFFWTRIFFRVK